MGIAVTLKNDIIAVDLMGGDHAPDAAIGGCISALKEGTKILALGDENAIERLNKCGNFSNLRTIKCDQVIDTEEQPVSAIRHKTDSTIVKGLTAVKNKQAGAFVSAGSTGALVAGGVLIVRRAKGVSRPCIATVLPSEGEQGVLFMDLGASSDVRPGTLVEFGFMGKIYAEQVLGWRDPKISLLNIGVEKNKGNSIAREAYKMLSEAPLNFIGNIEARDVFTKKTDVVVTDGFTGNIFLKACEGTALFQSNILKHQIHSSKMFKLGAFLLKPVFSKTSQILNYSAYGGAPLLGLNGCLIKCHGSSGAFAMANGIKQALKFLSRDVISIISETLSKQHRVSQS